MQIIWLGNVAILSTIKMDLPTSIDAIKIPYRLSQSTISKVNLRLWSWKLTLPNKRTIIFPFLKSKSSLFNSSDRCHFNFLVFNFPMHQKLNITYFSFFITDSDTQLKNCKFTNIIVSKYKIFLNKIKTWLLMTYKIYMLKYYLLSERYKDTKAK